MDDQDPLDIVFAFTATDEDRDALRRLRQQTPSWLEWDWRTLTQLTPRSALLERPTATEAWQPFRLD